jgi:zinc transport system permease protein
MIPAIVRGFAALLIAGTFFPVTGVYVLRFNLFAFRFTVMHAVILAGAVALALKLDMLPVSLLLCAGITLLLSPVARVSGADPGMVSILFMILTMAGAVAVMYKFQVSAKDTLEILWGNIYALSNTDLVLTGLFALIPSGFTFLFYRKVSCLIFDREIAYTTGINEKVLMHTVLVVTGMTIAFIMRLIGALLLDAVLILPALAAMGAARNLRSFYLLSMGAGFVSTLAGFMFSVYLDLPASAGVSLAAGSLFMIVTLVNYLKKRRNRK